MKIYRDIDKHNMYPWFKICIHHGVFNKLVCVTIDCKLKMSQNFGLQCKMY